MEIVWMVPLYIICPLIGLFLVSIYFKKREAQYIPFYFGLILLVLPILHFSFIEISNLSIDNQISGVYQIDNLKVLEINEDETFQLKENNFIAEHGKGKWEIFHGDKDELILRFDNRNGDWIIFNIYENGQNLELVLGNNVFTKN